MELNELFDTGTGNMLNDIGFYFPADEQKRDKIADIVMDNYKRYPADSDIVSIRYAIIMSSGNYDAETVWRKSR